MSSTKSLVASFGVLFAVATCGGGGDTWDGDTEVDLACRSTPRDCEGEIGSACAIEEDCFDGVCCLSRDCGRGMCTYLCGSGGDCPVGMDCDDGFCFFTCNQNADCAPGQECEDSEICQFE